MVIWLVGLSGAGKTTIGRKLYSEINAKFQNTVFLDGDELRKVFKNDQGEFNYTIEGRKQNSDKIVGLCQLLDSQDINVICSVLSIFPDVLAENRVIFSDYMEIYVTTSLEILKERDTKGLYSAADAGLEKNVVGVDIFFPEPVSPDFILDTSSGPSDLTEIIDSLSKRLKS